MNNVVIENARIFIRNFSGEADKFNKEGSRYFCVILPTETATAMSEQGWNVRWLDGRDDDIRTPYIQVAVGFKFYPPKIVLISSSGRTSITEDTVSMLDWAELEKVDIIIRPREYSVSGRSGIKAYLKTMYATLVEDELDIKYAKSDVPF